MKMIIVSLVDDIKKIDVILFMVNLEGWFVLIVIEGVLIVE